MTSKTTKYFSIASGGQLLNEYKKVLRYGLVYKSVKRHILFVCGGDINGDENFRRRFLTYANDNLSAYHIFLAEPAFNSFLELDDNITHNLALFEKTICEVSDCIIIFPESAGSYCEVGFFSHKDDIRRKTLIVNDYDFHASNSFINEGPIALIDKETKFSSRIVLRKDAPEYDKIRDRLNSKLKISTRRKSFNCDNYANLSLQDKLFIINEIINIFGPCSLLSIEEISRGLFDTYKRIEIQQILSILLGGRLIAYSTTYPNFVFSLSDGEDFIEYSGNFRNDLRLKVLEHYRSNNLKPYQVFDEKNEGL